MERHWPAGVVARERRLDLPRESHAGIGEHELPGAEPLLLATRMRLEGGVHTVVHGAPEAPERLLSHPVFAREGDARAVPARCVAPLGAARADEVRERL